MSYMLEEQKGEHTVDGKNGRRPVAFYFHLLSSSTEVNLK